MKRDLSVHLGCARFSIPGVLLYGLGAIGTAAARYLVQSRAYPLLGAVDPDPAKAGKPLGEVIGLAAQDLPVVAARLADALAAQGGKAPRGAVALHMAGSHLPAIEPHLIELARAGFAVVSSAEELAFPRLQHPAVAARLDAGAKEHGVAIAGAGVNPGFVMDFLPMAVAQVCRDIERVEVDRIVDAATRREPLQRKIGCGLTPERFEALARERRIGHVGLVESCAFVAEALGLAVDTISEELQPAIAARKLRTEFLAVEAGQVCGIKHSARASAGGAIRVALDLHMYLGAPDSHDEVRVVGQPPLTIRIMGGTPGDFATVAALINAVPRVAQAPPGLHTMRDLPFAV